MNAEVNENGTFFENAVFYGGAVWLLFCLIFLGIHDLAESYLKGQYKKWQPVFVRCDCAIEVIWFPFKYLIVLFLASDRKHSLPTLEHVKGINGLYGLLGAIHAASMQRALDEVEWLPWFLLPILSIAGAGAFFVSGILMGFSMGMLISYPSDRDTLYLLLLIAAPLCALESANFAEASYVAFKEMFKDEEGELD